MTRRTKIVGTIGPASDSEETLVRLMTAGMNVARVNFSHGTEEYHRTLIRRIHHIRRTLNKPVAILQDLQGPKIRIGMIRDGAVELEPGREFVLTTDPAEGDAARVSVSLQSLPYEVSAGHPILLADGNIELRVERVAPPDVVCRVIVGGTLSSRKGVNLPGSHVSIDSLTAKDRKDIRTGLEEGVDAIALSFVRAASDLAGLRKIVQDGGKNVPIVAKIEKHEAVANIDTIVDAADAVMVARGDLGVEIDLELVPLVQKKIIRKCNLLGKPVITATQMLVRMVDSARPTRAEAADVANAVLDGTDAVMLSEETAAGMYPVESVTMMDRILRSAESALEREKFERAPRSGQTRDAISRACYSIAEETGAAAILTPTWSGSTPSRVARFRPQQPIIATTPNAAVLNFLSLVWGVIPLAIPAADSIDDMIQYSIAAARKAGCLDSGQKVVIAGGAPLHVSGSTNFIKVECVE